MRNGKKTQKLEVHLSILPVLILVAVCLAGCPPAPQDIQLSRASMDFEKTRVELDVAITSNAAGQFPWTASSDVAWLEFDPPSGAGAATMTVRIDRSELPLGQATGAITVQSGSAQKVIQVSADCDTGLGGAYWPLQVGNAWEYGLPAFQDLYPSAAPSKSGQAVYSLSVQDRQVVAQDTYGNGDGIEVWTVGVAVPLLDAVSTLVGFWPWLADIPQFPFESILAKNQTLQAAGANTLVHLYVAAVDDTWYVTANEDALANLPETNGFYLLDDALKGPADVMNLLYSGKGTVLMEDIMAIADQVVTDMDEYLMENQVSAKSATVWPQEWQEIEAMLLAFSNDFSGYENNSAVYTHTVRALAVLFGGADTFEELAGNLEEIANGLPERFETINLELPEYLDAVYADPSLEAPLLAAFAAEFTDYPSDNILIADTMNLLAAVGDYLAVAAANSSVYTENDYAALSELAGNVSRFVSVYSISALMNPEGFGESLRDYLAAYPSNGSQAVQDVLSASDSVIVAMTTLLEDICDEERAEGRLQDMIALQQDLNAFFTDYVDTHDDTIAAFLAEATEVTIESLGYMPAAAAVFKDFVDTVKLANEADRNFTPADRDPANFADMADDLAQWFDVYAAPGEDGITDEGELAAGIAGIAMAGIRDTIAAVAEVKAELDSTPLTTHSGSLSEFTPIDHGAFQLQLMDFGIAALDDCRADGILLGPEATFVGRELPEWLPANIYGRNVGPVLYGGIFTLQSATIAGLND